MATGTHVCSGSSCKKCQHGACEYYRAGLNACSTHSSLCFILVLQRFKLVEHCYAVQRFILLGQVLFQLTACSISLLTQRTQGDFARILMEMLGEELSKPAHAAMRHNITGIVEAALRTSASAGEDTVYAHADNLN